MMLQVSIFHTAEYLVERRDRIDQRRIWLQNIYNLLHPIHHSLGSFANIHLANFPEAQKAIPIINHWVEDCLFSLRSDRFSPFFLNNLVQMSSLAFLLNRFRAQRYLGIIPCVQKEPLRRYIREDNMNIVHDILKLLDGSGELPIVAGVLFLKRVVSAKLWINFSNVCSILESICYSIVITRRLRNGSLHNTILPRQWILTLPTANSESIAARSIPINLVVELVDIVHALLVGIFSNNPEDFEYLLFEYRNWQESDLWQIIYISLSRICRSLCLLSCNMATPLIRDRIVSTIQILAKSQHEFPAFCAMYAEARNWDELWFALRASGQQPRSTLDELLFLQDETRAPPKKIWGTRTIPYREWSAALNDLQATASGSHNDANHSRNIAVQSNADDLEKDGDDGMRVHAISTSHEDIASEELPADVVEPLAAADDIIVNDSLASEEQVKAARTIQRAYRNFFRRRSDRAYRSLFQQRYSHAALIILKAYRQYRVRKDTHPSRIVERRYRLRSACHATVAQESLSGLYKSYFCDQLPHALVCLEEMYAYVSKCKEADGKRLRGNKVVLEEVHAIMANNVALFKQVTGLQKALGPRSELHRSQNVDLLKQKILELEQLVRKLPQGISNEWAFDFRMAMRAMKGVDEVRRKEKRPRLNIDDIDLVYS
ncbi:hypothetical protein QCA50_008569 [Cerrena zonata]|uniref:Uncharacterized protein n=1 Tax=Cerrena zonata TaxID=2478898 RepID=A0AAW0G9A9_9APHY